MNNIAMPHSIELEATVLNAFISHTTDIVPGSGELTRDDFYSHLHGDMWEAIQSLIRDGQSIDILSMSQKLRQHPKIATKIGQMLELAQWQVDYSHLVEDLKSYTRQRTLLKMVGEAPARIMDSADSGEDFLRTGLIRLLTQRVTKTAINQHELQSLMLESVARGGNVEQGIPFGFKDLDEKTHGVTPGQLIIVAARPNVGKSAFLLNVAINMLTRGKSIYFASVESSRSEVSRRMLSNLSQVYLSSLYRERLNDEMQNKINHVIDQIGNFKFVLDDYALNTTDRIMAECSALKMQGRLDAIFVDYLQILKDKSDTKDNQWYKIGLISTALKSIARVLDVPLIAAAQLNREIEPQEAPELRHLANSGQIERDADVVIGMWVRNEDEPVTSFRILKQRDGERFDFSLKFHGAICTFSDL